MKSIIKEIFYGKRGHSEAIEMTEKYWALMKEAEELRNLIEKDLPKEKEVELDKLSDVLDGLDAEAVTTYYIEGLKIGILLGIEVCS